MGIPICWKELDVELMHLSIGSKNLEWQLQTRAPQSDTQTMRALLSLYFLRCGFKQNNGRDYTIIRQQIMSFR